MLNLPVNLNPNIRDKKSKAKRIAVRIKSLWIRGLYKSQWM